LTAFACAEQGCDGVQVWLMHWVTVSTSSPRSSNQCRRMRIPSDWVSCGWCY